ncbi:hypothetical protein PIB30_055631, partial [Stylosanthes scabra]|nr:hypothetical protein [Stylosanthes scabra]
MSGRGRGSSQSSSRSRGRGRGRSAPSSETVATVSPSTSTPVPCGFVACVPAESPTQQVERIPITWDNQKGFDPNNNVCTQAIYDVIELMLNEINYSKVPAEVQKRWYEKCAEKQIRKAYDYRVGRCYQQIMRDLCDCELQRLKWLSETLRLWLLHKFATDSGFLKRSGVNKVNRASPKGGCLHTGGSATIPKTRARMTRSLDRQPTDAEVFRETHTRKRDRSIVEKRADDLL